MVAVKAKDVTFWDAVSIRIPEHWTCHRQPRGHWGCYDDAHPATVWVDFNVSLVDGADRPGPALVPDEPGGRAWISDLSPPPATYALGPGHSVMHSVETAYDGDDDAMLFFSRWHHMHLRVGAVVFCHLTFVLPEAMVETREGQGLVPVFDRELLNAVIDWDRLAATVK